MTFRIIRPDDSIIKVQTSTFRDRDNKGNTVDFGVIRDITKKS